MATGNNLTYPSENKLFCGKLEAYMLLGVVGAMLLLSLACNIFCCVSKYCSAGKQACRLRCRQSQSPRKMEDNPIYGNISFMQTEVDLPHTSFSSSPARDQHRVKADTQAKTQDCYANLTLKAPRPPSGRSSAQIEYTDVVTLTEPLDSKNEETGNADCVSNLSDLYASVQTQRAKDLNAADSGGGYANHI